MTLRDYDSDKDHIGLGLSEDELVGLTLVGGYAKELQREALGAQDFGGATDLIGQVPSLSRWTQDDFTGGGYQEDWTNQDAAMFSRSSSLISEPQSRALITVPPFASVLAFDPSAEDHSPAQPVLPLDMIRVGGYLFLAFTHGILRYNMGNGTHEWHHIDDVDWGIGGLGGLLSIVGLRWEANEQKLYVLMAQSTTAAPDTYAPAIYRLLDDFSAPTHNAQWDGPDGMTGNDAYGFTLSEGGIVLAVGTKLYLGEVPVKPNSKTGKVKWTLIDRLPGRWKDSCSYNGRTYILVSDNHKSTSLVAFDGSAIEPIADFPWNFDGVCMTQYAGRLYIGGHGTDINGGPNSAQLYEVTGASVRLVRDFAPIAARQSTVVPTSIRSMVVDAGLLWVNCKGLGLIGYDVTSDGLFGGSLYQQGADFDAAAMLGGYGRLWAWGHDDTDPDTKDGLYRIAQVGDDVEDYVGELITSDFVFEPASYKRLSELRVLTRFVSATAQLSTDGGDTWADCSRVDENVQGFNRICTFDLTGFAATPHWRFKLSLERDEDVDAVGELVAFTCSFAFLDTGLHAWTFTVNGSEAVEGRDGSTVSQDVSAIALQLWEWATQKTPLTLRDVNGSDYLVQVTGFRESQPVIGPNIPDAGRPEAFYALTLLEVGVGHRPLGDGEDDDDGDPGGGGDF